jgi:hypothetical protein
MIISGSSFMTAAAEAFIKSMALLSFGFLNSYFLENLNQCEFDSLILKKILTCGILGRQAL